MRPLFIILPLMLAGCVSVDPRRSLPEIEKTTGQRVHWRDGSAADEDVDREIASLLAKPLDADAAVQIALLNNRRLQVTYQSLGIAQADLVAAGLLRNPVFDAQIRFVEGGESPMIDLGIAFDFLDIVFVGLRKRIAEAQLDATKAAVSSAVLDLAGETRIAFYELQAAQQAVELDEQVMQATAASFGLAQRLREAGNNRQLDVDNEQALHEESRLELSGARLTEMQRRERLNVLLGAAGEQTRYTITSRLAEPSEMTIDASAIERNALDRSLELAAARAAITLSLRELGITRPLGLLSDLELGASAEREDGEWSVGPAIALPLPIFSQGQPALAAARARVRQAEASYHASAIEVRSAAHATIAQTQALQMQLTQYRDVLLPLRQRVVEQTQLQYNAMQIGAFQLLQAKRDQIETARAYLDVLRDYWIARSRLDLIERGHVMKEDE